MPILKSKIIGYTTLIFVGVVLFVVVLKKSYKEQSLGQEYMDNFRLNFSGIVTDKSIVTSDNGLLFLESITGVEIDYDPRDSLEYYCCIVKDGRAEIITAGMAMFNVGDSIFVNGDKNLLFHYRNGEFVRVINLTMSRFDLLYDPAKKLHRIK